MRILSMKCRLNVAYLGLDQAYRLSDGKEMVPLQNGFKELHDKNVSAELDQMKRGAPCRTKTGSILLDYS